MGLFSFKKKSASAPDQNESALATLILNNISDGVVMIGGGGAVELMNPAAAALTGYEKPELTIGLSYTNVIHLQDQQAQNFNDTNNPLIAAVRKNEPFNSRKLLLVTSDNQRQIAIHLTMTPTGGPGDKKIITFHDITEELAEENEQSEFISTASHEMRTPVAAIEGYLGLALNPQTATIDDRARGYLSEAHKSSKQLGQLFKDLLDVTKLDDGRLKPHLVPLEVVAIVKGFADEYSESITAKRLHYTFGSSEPDIPIATKGPHLDQLVYAQLDTSFLREIMDNLIGNAVKYTPEGGNIWVNVRGDGDKVLINVTDSGIGISTDDLAHVFQKFYRADNSQTRSIGGTGLGLYLVKQRVEAMGGRVWAESVFGEGSTFYVSFPRLNASEYERLKQVSENSQIMQGFVEGQAGGASPDGPETSGATLTTGAVPVSAKLPSEIPAADPPAPSVPPVQVPAPAGATPVETTPAQTLTKIASAKTAPTVTPAPAVEMPQPPVTTPTPAVETPQSLTPTATTTPPTATAPAQPPTAPSIPALSPAIALPPTLISSNAPPTPPVPQPTASPPPAPLQPPPPAN